MVSAALAARVRSELPAWRVDGEEVTGRWAFADFAGALAAAIAVGAVAERADHHPEMRVAWGSLEVRITTHSAGALTERDLTLAAAIQGAIGAPQG